MKFVINLSPTRLSHGIASSLGCLTNADVMYWHSHGTSIMDMFDEIQPDILLCEPELLRGEEISIAIARYPNTKLVCLGTCDKELNAHFVIGDSNNPKVPSVFFADGAMIAQINNGKYDPKLDSEVMIYTDYIKISDDTNDFISLLCEKYRTKIFGSKKISVPNYLGNIDLPTRSNAIASTKVYVDLDGGSWYDAATIGTLATTHSSRKQNIVKSFSSVQELQENVKELMSIENREPKIKLAKAAVRNQTYFEPVCDMLSFFDLKEYVDQLKEIKRKIL